MANVAKLMKFIKARHSIYEMRAAGKPWPWTVDPILQQYRFCNVYRNLDKETQLIHNNWLHPYGANKDLWFAMVAARLVNWWPSLNEVGFPLPWNPKRFIAKMDARKKRGEKQFTGSYMVRADAVVEGSKAAYLAHYVLQPMWDDRVKLRPKPLDTLDSFHKRLMGCRDMGSFMAAQVVADIKYSEYSQLVLASDWGTWAASGPGSRRGLARLTDRKLSYNWKESEWRAVFADLHKEVEPLAAAAGLPYITGQDLQNCLCEYDKYQRVLNGEGFPRSKYHRNDNNLE